MSCLEVFDDLPVEEGRGGSIYKFQGPSKPLKNEKENWNTKNEKATRFSFGLSLSW